jgi:hypothetical protein
MQNSNAIADTVRTADGSVQPPKPDTRLLQFAKDWIVRDQDTADMAGAKVEQCRMAVNRIMECFKPHKQCAQEAEARKALVISEKELIAPINAARDLLTRKVRDWQAEERRAAQRAEESRDHPDGRSSWSIWPNETSLPSVTQA